MKGEAFLMKNGKKVIGMLHFRVGETDGVSLEMDKWKIVLEQMGHEVKYIAGSGGNITDYVQVEALHYKHPDNEWLVDVIYKKNIHHVNEEEVRERLASYQEVIKNDLTQVIDHHQIDILIVNNVLSLGWNIAAGLGLIEAVEETGIELISHHHDFHWERELYSNPKYSWVRELLEDNFPPRINQAKHVVINTIAQEELKKRGFESIIVPNVLNFEKKAIHYQKDSKAFRRQVGISDNEIIFLQATRVVPRKGIELIIDVIENFNHELNRVRGKRLYDGRIIDENTEAVLILAGQNEDSTYYNRLMSYAASKKVKVKDISQRFTHQAIVAEEKTGLYPFMDVYLLADIVSYPSLLEGFGNQFLEAVYEEKPIVVYEYPVYCTDLSHLGFSLVHLGSHHYIKDGLAKIEDSVVEASVEDIFKMLLDEQVYQKHIKNNFHICLENFSYKTLRKKLETLI